MAIAFGASRAVPAWNLPALQSCSETRAVGASGWTPRGELLLRWGLRMGFRLAVGFVPGSP